MPEAVRFPASLGAPMAVSLVVLMLGPLATVIGYETVGHRHLTAAVQRAVGRPARAG